MGAGVENVMVAMPVCNFNIHSNVWIRFGSPLMTFFTPLPDDVYEGSYWVRALLSALIVSALGFPAYHHVRRRIFHHLHTVSEATMGLKLRDLLRSIG